MSPCKRILRAFLSPPPLLILLIAVPSFAALFYVFLREKEDTVLAYLSYAGTAYVTTLVSLRLPAAIRYIKTAWQTHPLIRQVVDSQTGTRYRTDMAYRAEISLYMSLAVNLVYAVLKTASGILYRSIWFGALAAYYLLLCALRFSLLHYVHYRSVRQNLLAEWKRYRLCGAILLVMNQALAVVVALVVYRSSGFAYPGTLIYVMAMYTFYAVINAVRNLIRYRREGSPALSASKVIALVTALVSVLSLETAMLSQFGSTHEEAFRRIMTGLTGGAVCLIVLAMAVYMIANATRHIRSLRQGTPRS